VSCICSFSSTRGGRAVGDASLGGWLFGGDGAGRRRELRRFEVCIGEGAERPEASELIGGEFLSRRPSQAEDEVLLPVFLQGCKCPRHPRLRRHLAVDLDELVQIGGELARPTEVVAVLLDLGECLPCFLEVVDTFAHWGISPERVSN